MACLNFDLTPVPTSKLAVTATGSTVLTVTPAEQSVLSVAPAEKPLLSVVPVKQSTIAVKPVPQAKLTLGEVCTVSNDTIVVLSASDGPLRTRDGGYILLNPATNPPGA